MEIQWLPSVLFSLTLSTSGHTVQALKETASHISPNANVKCIKLCSITSSRFAAKNEDSKLSPLKVKSRLQHFFTTKSSARTSILVTDLFVSGKGLHFHPTAQIVNNIGGPVSPVWPENWNSALVKHWDQWLPKPLLRHARPDPGIRCVPSQAHLMQPSKGGLISRIRCAWGGTHQVPGSWSTRQTDRRYKWALRCVHYRQSERHTDQYGNNHSLLQVLRWPQWHQFQPLCTGSEGEGSRRSQRWCSYRTISWGGQKQK